MENIRKAWIGPSLKEASMTWEVGQPVYGGYKVSHFKEDTDTGTLSIYITKGDSSAKWKQYNSSMPWGVEYDLDFTNTK